MSVSSAVHWLERAKRAFPPRDLARVMLPHRALKMLFAYGLHLHHAERADDLDARDPELVGVAAEFSRALGRLWFRAEIEGVDHVPARGGALLVGSHNGGFLAFDSFLTVAAIAERHGLARAVRSLGHDFLFDDPTLRRFAQGVGVIRAGQTSAMKALARGDLVLVYPGGDVDTFRPFKDRYRVELAGRVGFVRLALRARVPIVPVVSVGTHEQLVIISRGDRIARLLRMHRWARTEVFPIALSLPWGLTSAFLPYLPLPAQTTVAFGRPMGWALGPEAADDDAIVHRCAREVEAAMQALLDRLSAGRRPWLGRPERGVTAPRNHARSPRRAPLDAR